MTVVDFRPIVLARGVFAPAAGSGEQGAPASGATVVLLDTTANTNGLLPVVDAGARIKRIRIVGLFSSHISATNGLTIDTTSDGGTNWDNLFQATVAATAVTNVSQGNLGANFRVRYVNSANTLTAWRFTILGDPFEAATA